jgi:hypothetical protein
VQDTVRPNLQLAVGTELEVARDLHPAPAQAHVDEPDGQRSDQHPESVAAVNRLLRAGHGICLSRRASARTFRRIRCRSDPSGATTSFDSATLTWTCRGSTSDSSSVNVSPGREGVDL